jgi:hypothetical protein
MYQDVVPHVHMETVSPHNFLFLRWAGEDLGLVECLVHCFSKRTGPPARNVITRELHIIPMVVQYCA